ncbi:hypothetical protein HHS_00690 [Candidatus Pantoea carbekii]|uniref:Uncharacterized protein n=1 Tax=Candidatus Pantoea carbekii TaxID=1235990 RepID=U3U716_9GAMM|nr:hypothetical protein HHS_00690 [Candidatus Pantoea carbekii]
MIQFDRLMLCKGIMIIVKLKTGRVVILAINNIFRETHFISIKDFVERKKISFTIMVIAIIMLLMLIN